MNELNEFMNAPMHCDNDNIEREPVPAPDVTCGALRSVYIPTITYWIGTNKVGTYLSSDRKEK